MPLCHESSAAAKCSKNPGSHSGYTASNIRRINTLDKTGLLFLLTRKWWYDGPSPSLLIRVSVSVRQRMSVWTVRYIAPQMDRCKCTLRTTKAAVVIIISSRPLSIYSAIKSPSLKETIELQLGIKTKPSHCLSYAFPEKKPVFSRGKKAFSAELSALAVQYFMTFWP